MFSKPKALVYMFVASVWASGGMVCVMCLHTTWFDVWLHTCVWHQGMGGDVVDPGVLQPVWQQVQWEEEEEEEEKVEMGTGLGPKCCRWLTVPRVAWPSHQATLAMHIYCSRVRNMCWGNIAVSRHQHFYQLTDTLAWILTHSNEKYSFWAWLPQNESQLWGKPVGVTQTWIDLIHLNSGWSVIQIHKCINTFVLTAKMCSGSHLYWGWFGNKI